MKRQEGKSLNKNFHMAIYFMAVFCIMALSGCGGGGDSSSSTPTGSVDGYIYLKAASKQKTVELFLAKEVPSGYVAVPAVIVILTGTSFTTATDANGYFIFNSVPIGTYILSAAKEGYQSITSTVSVSSGTTSHAEDIVSSPDTKVNYFPLVVGNTWEYDVSHSIGPFQDPVSLCVRKPTFTQFTATGTGSMTRTVEGTKVINNVTTYAVKEQISEQWNTGANDNITNTTWYAWNENQLLKYAYESTNPQTSTTYSTPLKDLVLPLYAGATWTNVGLGLQTYVVEAQENVTTTAGTFSSYRMTYSFAEVKDTQFLLWYMPKGLVKRDFFADKLENWQVTDYDPDEPAAGDPCYASGNCEDLNPGTEDTGCNNADIFDDKVDLLGTFSSREIYELKSYNVASKLAEKEDDLNLSSLPVLRTDNLNTPPLPKAKSAQLQVIQQAFFYPNPLRAGSVFRISYAVNPLSVVRVTITVQPAYGGAIYSSEGDPFSTVLVFPSGLPLSTGLYFVTVTAYTADGNAESVAKPLLIY